MTNRIAELRKRLGLSQRQLAERAGTSQQQIQRIEAGAQAARYDLAARIGVALGEPLRVVFPTTPLPDGKRGSKAEATLALPGPVEASQAGHTAPQIDFDPRQWVLTYRLSGGAKGSLPIASNATDRLWDAAESLEEAEGFLVFDSGSRRYAINPKHLHVLHFQFEMPEDGAEEPHDRDQATFTMADDGAVLSFDVDPDTKSNEEETAEGHETQMQDLFYFAEMGTDAWLRFTDSAGERACIRTDAISMFSVPLIATVPALLEATYGDDAGGSGQDNRSAALPPPRY